LTFWKFYDIIIIENKGEKKMKKYRVREFSIIWWVKNFLYVSAIFSLFLLMVWIMA